MPTPPGFATCSYELRHSLLSRSAFITFAVDPTATDPQVVADQCVSAFGAAGSLLACIDQNVTMLAARVALGTDGTSDVVAIGAGPIVCTWAGSSLPPNCAVLVHKRTARGGRRGKGRMYIPWAAGSAIPENGTVMAADVTRVGASFTAWRNALATNPGPLVLLHRNSEPGIPNPSPAGPPDTVTGHTVDPLIATQRRRLGR
jgi:hypothetical protein